MFGVPKCPKGAVALQPLDCPSRQHCRRAIHRHWHRQVHGGHRGVRPKPNERLSTAASPRLPTAALNHVGIGHAVDADGALEGVLNSSPVVPVRVRMHERMHVSV